MFSHSKFISFLSLFVFTLKICARTFEPIVGRIVSESAEECEQGTREKKFRRRKINCEKKNGRVLIKIFFFSALVSSPKCWMRPDGGATHSSTRNAVNFYSTQEVRYTRLIACGNFNARPNFMCQCRPVRQAPLHSTLTRSVLVQCNINLLLVQWEMAPAQLAAPLCTHSHSATSDPFFFCIVRLLFFFRVNLFFDIVTRTIFFRWKLCRMFARLALWNDAACIPQCTWMTLAARNTIFASEKFRHVLLHCMSKVKQFPNSSANFIPRMSWLVTHRVVADGDDYDDLANSQCSAGNKRNESKIVPNQKDLIPLQLTSVKWKLAAECRCQFCRIIPSRVTKECSKKTIWNIFNWVFRFPFFFSLSATIFGLMRTQHGRWMQKL